jgi:hypothetical protein
MGSELIGRPGDLAHIVSQKLNTPTLPNPSEDKACLIGLVIFLETIEKRNPDVELRGKAGLHVKALREMLKRHRKEGRVTVTVTDMDAYGAEKPKQLGNIRGLPHPSEILNIEAKEIK